MPGPFFGLPNNVLSPRRTPLPASRHRRGAADFQGADAQLLRRRDHLPHHGTDAATGLYDHVILDADSNPERGFAKEADLHPQVRCLMKLPDCYKIPEPSMGGGASSYTPDFGIVVTHRGLRDDAEIELHLVVETKSTEVLEELSAEEQIKIRCAVKHFEALGIPRTPASSFAGR